MTDATPVDHHTVPVLIVGGGGSGLAASVFLADLGVDSLLVERHPSTSPHPKAHILNGRTMEILAQHRLAEDVYRAGSPPENCSAMVWLTSLGGDEPYDRKVLYRTGAYGGHQLAERYADACGSRHGNLGQRWLEPLLRSHAEQRTPDGVLFGHELTGFSQHADGVHATVENRSTGKVLRVRARYLIGADGGKTIGRALGVRMIGTPSFREWITLHVRADFAPFLEHDDAIVNRVCSLTEDGRLEHCGVVPMGPKQWGRHSEEWTLMFARPPGGTADESDDATVELLVRRTLKLPDGYPMEINSISRWPVEGTVAERFAVGRVFLVGDAAHRHPPSGALGLNTGIQDSHNLAWKLAAVLSGSASPALLDSYQAERRPVAQRVVERAMFSLFNQVAISAGTGVVTGADPQWNRAQFTALFADGADGELRRALLAEYFDTNRITTAHLGLEMGYDYADAGFVLGDGTQRPEADPLGLRYTQTARPGHRMPHAWLHRDNSRISTHELLQPGSFLLITGPKAGRWRAAAEALTAAHGIRIRTVAVGPGRTAEFLDVDGIWAQLHGHTDDGALLVRPDGFVTARFDDGGPGAARSPYAMLRRGLMTALAMAL